MLEATEKPTRPTSPGDQPDQSLRSSNSSAVPSTEPDDQVCDTSDSHNQSSSVARKTKTSVADGDSAAMSQVSSAQQEYVVNGHTVDLSDSDVGESRGAHTMPMCNTDGSKDHALQEGTLFVDQGVPTEQDWNSDSDSSLSDPHDLCDSWSNCDSSYLSDFSSNSDAGAEIFL